MPKNTHKPPTPERSSKLAANPQRPPSKTKAGKKLFDQIIFQDWCKACGICMAFCPVQIINSDKHGKPEISDPDKCIGCRFCELHCPDFAITIVERHPRRRKADGKT